MRPNRRKLSRADQADLRESYRASPQHTGSKSGRLDTDNPNAWRACCRPVAPLFRARRTRQRHPSSQNCVCDELRSRSHAYRGWKSGDIGVVCWYWREPWPRRPNGSDLRGHITRYRSDVLNTSQKANEPAACGRGSSYRRRL